MIKTFEHPIDGQPAHFCIALADGPDGARAVISRVDSAETLVVMDIGGLLGTLKSVLESPDDFLDRAARNKARSEAAAEARAGPPPSAVLFSPTPLKKQPRRPSPPRGFHFVHDARRFLIARKYPRYYFLRYLQVRHIPIE
jgi:hypothetical protein